MESGDSKRRLYNANESITEAKLHKELMASDGTYFFIHDATEFIFYTLHYFCFFLVKLVTIVNIQFYHSHDTE